MKRLLCMAISLLLIVVCMQAQKITEGSLTFLKGQEKLNVVFDYSDLMIQGHKESVFLEKQGKEWAEQWENAKASYSERFLAHLNKNVQVKQSALIFGDYPDAQYQATVRVLTVGRVWGIACEVVFTKQGEDTSLAKVDVKGDSRRIGGMGGMGSNTYLTGTAFGYAGQNLGKFISKKIK